MMPFLTPCLNSIFFDTYTYTHLQILEFHVLQNELQLKSECVAVSDKIYWATKNADKKLIASRVKHTEFHKNHR